MAQPYQETEYADLLRRSGKWLADDRAITEDWRELEVGRRSYWNGLPVAG